MGAFSRDFYHSNQIVEVSALSHWQEVWDSYHDN